MRDRLKPPLPRRSPPRQRPLQRERINPTALRGPLYARFRKRITFPIANEQGKTIAFTARALEARDDKGRPIAKYMNSPETALYTKGQVLFNLDKAKSDIRAHDFALLVEGQMDCISVYMAGIHNVIATSGTAFTEMQVRLLSRFTKRVIVNFDPDTAGANAAEKSIALLTEEDFEVKVVTLEGGLDPDRFIREQGIQPTWPPSASQAPLRLPHRPRPPASPGRTADAKVKALNFLLPHIRRMPNRIQRDEFAADAAQKLGIDSAVMRQELKQAAAQPHRKRPLPPTRPRQRDRARPPPRPRPARRRTPRAPSPPTQLSEHPEWYESLPSAPLLEALSHAPAPPNPLDAAPDQHSRVLLARALQHSRRPRPTASTTSPSK